MELEENWSTFAGYEWAMFREVLLKAQEFYEQEKLPWDVADKTHSVTVNFYEFLKYFIPNVVVLETVFVKISASRKKHLLQYINFSVGAKKNVEITVSFGSNRSEVPNILIADFWEECEKDRASFVVLQYADLIINDWLETVLEEQIEVRTKTVIAKLDDDVFSERHQNRLYKEKIQPLLNELVDVISNLSSECYSKNVTQMILFQEKASQQVCRDLADSLNVIFSETRESTENLMVASAAEFLKKIHNDHGPSQNSERTVFKAIITSFLESGKVSKAEIANKLGTSRWTIDRIAASKCAEMASYEREFVEYGEDNLEINDFLEDALNEDENEYEQYIFDDSFGTDFFQQIEEDVEMENSDSNINFENIESPNLNDPAGLYNQLKRTIDNDSINSSLEASSTPGSLHS